MQASIQGGDGGNKPQVRPGKSSAKKQSAKHGPGRQATGSASEWSTKQIAGGVLGVLCFIVVCAAVLQRRSSATEGIVYIIYKCDYLTTDSIGTCFQLISC